MSDKKSLLAVFAFTPDYERKKILDRLLEKLQPLRDRHEIMVLSHSEISDLSLKKIDYFYYDSKNPLLKDFDVTNKFWFTTDIIDINSSLVYPVSTHLAIYRLIYYCIYFSDFMGFSKIHFMEYDFNLTDTQIIENVNNTLDEYDNVMFKRESDNWPFGVYFATNMRNLDVPKFKYDEESILNEVRSFENRMTEYVTPKILIQENRSIIYEPIEKMDPSGVYQFVDQHQNLDLKWCVPVCKLDTQEMMFFIFNELGGKHIVDVFVDDRHFSFYTEIKETWTIQHIGDVNNCNTILIFVDKKLKNSIILDESNREKFKENNFVRFL